MPRKKLLGKYETKQVLIRLPIEDEAVLRRQASQQGISLQAYIVKALSSSIVIENIRDIEDRMKALIATIPEQSNSKDAMLISKIALSTMTCEELLSVIVRDGNIQALYNAQDAAKAKLSKLSEV